MDQLITTRKITPFPRKGVAPQARGDAVGRKAIPLDPPSWGRGKNAATQRGAALVVALILLVVITLVGLAAISTTLIQNKSAANAYDRQIAFQATEAALRAGQNLVTTNATMAAPTPTGIEDCSTPAAGPPAANVCWANPFADSGPDKANITIKTVPASAYSSALAAAQPEYVVQYMGQFRAPTPQTRSITGSPPSYGVVSGGQLADYYRITARSGDPTKVAGRSIVTLQSTFRN